MLRRPLALLAAALLAVPVARAQPAGGALPATNAAVFAPLELPPPNAYRAADGRPGPAYWQQRADYRIEAALDTAAHRVSGTVVLTYTNNSPLPLEHLWLHLEQNRFAQSSRGSALTPPDSRWAGSFTDGGFRLGEVTVAQGGTRYAPAVTVDDTRMRVDLRQALPAAGGQLALTVPFSFVMPEYGADRGGLFEARRGTVYEVAQWYPKVAVYDDVNGWNVQPYLGQGEFYLGYGDFDVSLTVPSNMTVVASGALQNEAEVWAPAQRARLAEAMTGDGVVRVVTPQEVGQAAGRSGPTATWRFRIETARDVAWAASAAFRLDATSAANGAGGRVLILAAYPAEGVSDDPSEPGWEHGAEFSRHSIAYYSREWFPYPYPAAVSVAGVVGGMEYPGIQFSSVEARGFGLFGVIDHELGHNWFPMIVGSDERRHAWMDEGLDTFLNVRSNVAYFDEGTPPFGAGRADETRWVHLTRNPATLDYLDEPYAQDQAVMTYPDRLRPQSLGWFAYRRPGKGLLILRDYVLGPERFDPAFREYIARWAYKHPQPADFFRTIEDVAGEDLDWFWRQWFVAEGDWRYDAAVAAVEPGGGGTTLVFENRAEMVFPLTAEVTFADGTTTRVHVPVEAFFLRDRVTAGVPGDRRVTRVVLDPDGHLPDEDPDNNTWTGRGR